MEMTRGEQVGHDRSDQSFHLSDTVWYEQSCICDYKIIEQFAGYDTGAVWGHLHQLEANRRSWVLWGPLIWLLQLHFYSPIDIR